MPRIKIYEQQTNAPDLTRSAEVNPNQAAQAGKNIAAIGQMFSEAGEIGAKVKEQMEISDTTAGMAELQTKYTQRWNDELQKGKIDREKFMQDYDEDLAKIGDNLTTRGANTFLTRSGSSAKNHFAESLSAGEAELRSVKTKENYHNTRKQYTSSLLTDPSSFKTIQEQHSHYIETLVETGGLDQKTAASFRLEGETDIAKSAVRGWIDLNPQDAKAQLDAGKWDKSFDGDVKKQLLGEADSMLRANRADAERAEKEAEKALTERQKAIQNDFLVRMVEGKLSAKEIVHSDLEPTGGGSKAQFLSMLETDNKRDNKITTDAGVFTDLFRRTHLPDGDPDKITDENSFNAYLGRGLTIADIGKLRKEFQGTGTVAGKEEAALKRNIMNIAKSKLTKSNPMMGLKDPEGDTQFASFTSTFMEEFSRQRAEGKSAKALLTPGSPDYLGALVENYVKTPQQIMRDNIKAVRKKPSADIDPAKKRKEGETVDQWRERMKTVKPAPAQAGI